MKSRPAGRFSVWGVLLWLALARSLSGAALSAEPVVAELPYAADFRAFAEADRGQPPVPGGVLFVGSSIFRQWTNVAAMLAPLPAPVLNRAFGGSRTGDQLVRFEQAVMPYVPRVIVYYCGSNDLKAGDDPAAIFGRFQEFSQRVLRDLPATRLVFVSSTRSPDRVDKWDRVERYNRLVREYCAIAPRHTFVDVNPTLVDAAGHPRLELYQDDWLHLRPAAYEGFARTLRPVVARLLTDDPASPRTPPGR